MTNEQAEVLGWFLHLLQSATADGGRKRAAGEKPSWKVDTSHEAAIFSHLNKWKHGEKKDKDSGAHPLVHAAWRCLAIAWQESMSIEAILTTPAPLGEGSKPDAPHPVSAADITKMFEEGRRIREQQHPIPKPTLYGEFKCFFCGGWYGEGRYTEHMNSCPSYREHNDPGSALDGDPNLVQR
jgi:hypothetical protein